MSARPRIGLVLNTIGHGGVPQAALELVRHCDQERFDFHLYVLKPGKMDGAQSERLERWKVQNVHVTVSGSSSKLDMIAGVADWLADRQIDILHSHSYRPNLYARIAGAMLRPAGLRMLAHYHNQYDDKWLAEPATLAIERQLIQSTDAMVAVSRSVRDHVSDHLGIDRERVDVVPNGLDPAAYTGGDRKRGRSLLGARDGQFAFGLVGRVCEQKGQDVFVEAAIRLAASREDTVFLMVGNQENAALQDLLQRRITNAGLEDRIRFVGHLSAMADVYSGLDALVAPSRWEGFGLMLVEAMAAGLPVIATSAGAIPEVTGNGDAALMVPPDDAPALHDAMAGLMDDRSERERLATAGCKLAESYSWSQSAARMTAVYDALLGGKS